MGCAGSKEPKEPTDKSELSASQLRRLETRNGSITNAELHAELEDAKISRMSTSELRSLETRTMSLGPDELAEQLKQANLGHLATSSS